MDLLFLAHRVPFPPDRGDKIRSFHVLRHVAKRARVHLVAFADDPADRDPPPAFRAMLASCTILPRTKSNPRAAIEALATGRPASLTAFADPAMRGAVDAALATRDIDAIYCFSGQMAQYLPESRLCVMDFVDVDSAKFAATPARWPMRWLLRREARLLGAFERSVSECVTASLFVSEAEAALFRQGGGGGRVIAVENGIDAGVFDPAIAQPLAGDGCDSLIVFTGQMDYQPNVAAVTTFAERVLPRIRAVHPAARFAIVGRAPTPVVLALGRRAGVIVTGAVADVRPWLAAAAVCVAPLALARGIQNKVLEAMAMARPVVASSSAAEGIDHGGTIRVADDDDGIARLVVALLDDPAAAALLGGAARTRVIARYDWAARLAPLDTLLMLDTAA